MGRSRTSFRSDPAEDLAPDQNSIPWRVAAGRVGSVGMGVRPHRLNMTTWVNSQFPRPDFHRQVQRHYGLQN